MVSIWRPAHLADNQASLVLGVAQRQLWTAMKLSIDIAAPDVKLLISPLSEVHPISMGSSIGHRPVKTEVGATDAFHIGIGGAMVEQQAVPIPKSPPCQLLKLVWQSRVVNDVNRQNFRRRGS